MGKRSSISVRNSLPIVAPQEAPATPINPPVNTAATAPPPQNSASFVSRAKKPPARKPSAATLEGPFSSLDIADAEEADSETKATSVSARRTSINRTRTGKPMDDPSPQKNEDANKKTRRGGKSRKKELAAQEKKASGDGQIGSDVSKKK